NLHGERCCITRNIDIFVCGENSETNAHSDSRRNVIHRPISGAVCAQSGHKVTTFNRGKTHPGELPNDVEQLIGDRNSKLDALKGGQWDVVIDNPTTLPAWVRDAAQILKGNVERYVFISTISVYGEVKTGPDETAPTEKYQGADPYKETLEAMKASGYKTYGPLKALSEKE